LIGNTGTAITFVIENIGSSPLNLTGTPFVQLGGTNAADFILTQPGISTIAPGGNTTFNLAFAPTAEGPRTATIMIPSSDPDEASYSITLNGTGVMPIMVVLGNTTSTTQLYNPITHVFSSGNPMSATIGGGGHSFLIPSGVNMGKRLVICGNSTKNTSLYDPATGTFTTGPSLNSPAYTAGNGANSFTIASGGYNGCIMTIFANNTNATSIFNPSTNSFIAGPDHPSAPYPYNGSLNMPVADGRTLLVRGTGTGTCDYYDPGMNMFSGGFTFSTLSISMGSHGFIIPSGTYAGRYMIIAGNGTTNTAIYDPSGPSQVAGPTLSAPTGLGAHSFLITSGPDAGKVLVVCGYSTGSTCMYDPSVNAFSTGPSLSGTVGSGAFSFIIKGGPHKGKTLVVRGNATPTTALYDPIAGSFSTGPNLSAPVGLGAHCFPAK
jgi:hypothetical protein